jgi:hypothetical protein
MLTGIKIFTANPITCAECLYDGQNEILLTYEMAIKIFEQLYANGDENFYGEFHMAKKKL